MRKKTIIAFIAPMLALVLALSTGCAQTGKHEVAGTVLGGAVGAGTGAIIGSQVGAPGAGVAIGSAIGAGAGNMIGRGLDEVASHNEPQARQRCYWMKFWECF